MRLLIAALIVCCSSLAAKAQMDPTRFWGLANGRCIAEGSRGPACEERERHASQLRKQGYCFVGGYWKDASECQKQGAVPAVAPRAPAARVERPQVAEPARPAPRVLPPAQPKLTNTQPARPDAQIERWFALNNVCRGSAGTEGEKACVERETVAAALDKSGWCYGRKDQTAVDYRWHGCEKTSLRPSLPIVSPNFDQNIIGFYEGTGEGDIGVEIKQNPDGTLLGHFSTSNLTGCGGAVKGVGKPGGASLEFLAPSELHGTGKICRITVQKSNANSLKVEEVEGCVEFHGAACGFSGTVRKMATKALPPSASEPPKAAIQPASAPLEILCEGKVVSDTKESAVGGCQFKPNSPAAQQILATCKPGDFCEVAATGTKNEIEIVARATRKDGASTGKGTEGEERGYYEPRSDPNKLAVGSRAGDHFTIISKAGLNTRAAKIVTKQMRDDARDACRGYEVDYSLNCIERELGKHHQQFTATANCLTGDFVMTWGRKLKFSGINKTFMRSEEHEPEYAILEKGEVLDPSTASGYGVALTQFRSLCPVRFGPPEGAASPYFTQYWAEAWRYHCERNPTQRHACTLPGYTTTVWKDGKAVKLDALRVIALNTAPSDWKGAETRWTATILPEAQRQGSRDGLNVGDQITVRLGDIESDFLNFEQSRREAERLKGLRDQAKVAATAPMHPDFQSNTTAQPVRGVPAVFHGLWGTKCSDMLDYEIDAEGIDGVHDTISFHSGTFDGKTFTGLFTGRVPPDDKLAYFTIKLFFDDKYLISSTQMHLRGKKLATERLVKCKQ